MGVSVCFFHQDPPIPPTPTTPGPRDGTNSAYRTPRSLPIDRTGPAWVAEDAHHLCTVCVSNRQERTSCAVHRPTPTRSDHPWAHLVFGAWCARPRSTPGVGAQIATAPACGRPRAFGWRWWLFCLDRLAGLLIACGTPPGNERSPCFLASSRLAAVTPPHHTHTRGASSDPGRRLRFGQSSPSYTAAPVAAAGPRA